MKDASGDASTSAESAATPARRRRRPVTAEDADDRTSVEKAFSLIRAFGGDAGTGVSLSELARRAGLSKSTAFRILGQLQANGAVERGSSAYRLGVVADTAPVTHTVPVHERVRARLTPFLAELFEATMLTVGLAVLSGRHVIYLNSLLGPGGDAAPERRVGTPLPAYCTAAGKALIAFDEPAFKATMRARRESWTEHTITEPKRLREEIRHVRQSGVAFDSGESAPGIGSVAAAVVLPGRVVAAALCVSGEIDAFHPQEHVVSLRRVARLATRAMLGDAIRHRESRRSTWSG